MSELLFQPSRMKDACFGYLVKVFIQEDGDDEGIRLTNFLKLNG